MKLSTDSVTKAYEQFAFFKAVQSLTNFVTVDLAFYFDVSKESNV